MSAELAPAEPRGLASLDDGIVRLRSVRADDASAILAVLEGAGGECFSLGEEVATKNGLEQRLAHLACADPAWGGGWAVTNVSGEAPVGLLLFGDRQAKDQRATIAYILAAQAQGRGLMQRALTLALTHLFELGLHRIEADVEPGNFRSRRLLNQLGFRCESGVLRDRVVIHGMRRSVLMYALLAPEWWARRAGCGEREGAG